MRQSAPRFLALVLGVALLVAACGNDGPQVPAATEASVIATVDRQRLTAAEFLDEGGGANESARPAPPTTATPRDAADAEVLVEPVASPVPTVPLDERPPLPSSVAVVGDSIARSATDVVASSIWLHGIDIIAYDALESRRMATWGGADLPSGVAAVGDVVSGGDEPELWIVALGTNDVAGGTDRETVQAHIDELLDEIPDDASLFWIDTWVRDLDERANMFNLLLRATLADRPNSWVLDWHALAATDGLISDDGVHLTARGQLEYARMIGRALRDTFTRSQT